MGSILYLTADRLDRVLHPVTRRLNFIAILTVGVMALPVVLDILARLTLNTSMKGIMDIEEFMLVFIVFLAFAQTQVRKDHVVIELLFSRLPQWLQPVVECFNHLAGVVLFALMSWQLTQEGIKKLGVHSHGIEAPITVFMLVASLGTLVLALVLLSDLLRAASAVLKNGRGIWLLIVIAAALALFMTPLLLKMMSVRLSGLVLGTAGFCTLFILLFLRMPIGFAMALVGFLGMFTVNGHFQASLSMMGSAAYYTIAHFVLAVAPMFILMGELAFISGISQDLFNSANKWLGRLPGGLAMSGVAGCAGFAAVCGESLATAITMGTVALPEMRKKHYSPSLATGCLAAGGTLGILIPPSVGFIFYALVTEESIGKLFIAGIIPGVLLAAMFMAAIYIMARRNPALAPPGEPSTFAEKIASLKGVIGMLLLFVLILGGILGGIFSPTEGGAVGAIGAFIYALSRRRLSLKSLEKALDDAARLTSKLLTILVGVGVLGFFLAATKLPFMLADLVTGLSPSPYVVLVAVLILYIILGCVMNVI
ncbi:MAG: TRAP transporter large permease subunit, partial [Peptococcaceae bacterium]|nr:TRAP transporter large permease subunit [Peptococcaceae bacterium]